MAEITDALARYPGYRTRSPLRIHGRLDEPAWAAAPKSPRFVDMLTGVPGFFDTGAFGPSKCGVLLGHATAPPL